MRAPRGFGEFFAELSSATVAYHPRLVKVTGGVTSTILLDQLLYWTPRVHAGAEGWIYKTQAEIEEETGLTRFEQETARKRLRDRGIVEEKKAGVPAKLFFRVNLGKLSEIYEATYPVGEEIPQDAGIPQPRMQKPSNLQRAHSADKDAGIPQPLLGTESTYRDYVQPPKVPQSAAVGERLPAAQKAEVDQPKPSKPKPATNDAAQNSLFHSQVGEWLQRYKAADDDEVTYVLGELDKKRPGEVDNPNAYADKVLQKLRADQAETARNQERLRRTLEAEQEPICDHSLRLSSCPECFQTPEQVQSNLAAMLAKLTDKMSA